MNIAHTLRPQTLSDFVGQEHLIGKGKILRNMLEAKHISSLILWGPPGTGKTTLAMLIAHTLNIPFYHLSAVTAKKEELLRIIQTVQEQKASHTTILFMDEIHRWTKLQQDTLLPSVETGLITLIGATTENPSFSVNSALLSRCRVVVLKPLTEDDMVCILDRAMTHAEEGLNKYKKTLSDAAKKALIQLSGGDARVMLQAAELAVTNTKEQEVSEAVILDVFQNRSQTLYDKTGEEHYTTISAFIKCMRASDVDASLYYLLRMIHNGEDPLFIARRMIIFASEDIGLSDRGALIQANACFEAVQKIGFPEASLILSHICVYLCLAKKSRAIPNAMMKAQEVVQRYPHEPIPLHLRNATTKLNKNLGYGKDYTWSPDYVGPTTKESLFPKKVGKQTFFE